MSPPAPENAWQAAHAAMARLGWYALAMLLLAARGRSTRAPWVPGIVAALGIVALDGVLHERERAFITRLRAALGLAEATLVAIEAEHGIAPAVA